MTKHSIIKKILPILAGATVLFTTHRYVIADTLELQAKDSIVAQHIFFLSLIVLTFFSTAITYLFSPKNTGFVFLGLLLAKMIIASFFVYQMGWFDSVEFWNDKLVFLVCYFLYTILLIKIIIPFLKQI
ncbi:hypothetical protein ACE939_12985 [Aquimarina sp. W85]|uniref:hypothetical protein n=1 Tax=Aquimarina rhodophyticola TaxID=3342246 RepID=UPI00366E2D49